MYGMYGMISRTIITVLDDNCSANLPKLPHLMAL